MPQTQVNCPRCRQPVTANVEQLFDVTHDPGAKQRLLSGVANYLRCPYCGYEGHLATPIVYHDAEKELLLTYFPPELNLPVNEQEKMIGPLINQVMNRLPPEKRKGYLFNPQNHLTYQSLIERILQADGITPEMLKAQQERVNLIERLLRASSDDVRSEILKQEASLIDEQFFTLFGHLLQNAIAAGQEQLAQQMASLQKQLLQETEIGRKIQSSVGEFEAAVKSLQEAGEGLTREKLLEIVIAAPNEERLKALVGLARGGMDYIFFQMLSERIEAAEGEEKKRLEGLRERLLEYVNEIDRQIEERYKQAQEFIEALLEEEDVAKATRERLDRFDEIAVDVLNTLLRRASDENDTERLQKLQQIVGVLKEAATPPPEVLVMEKLLAAPDADAMEKVLQENETLINERFVQALGGLVAQMDAQVQAGDGSEEEKTLLEQAQRAYRAALRFSMKKQMEG
ncbi:MAG: hypothetical protein D6770_07280 [Anaerolineae bacterium]|nr:MAG: hypothetical protein D6770_07280 [Anaerolineae bacterium]